MDQTRMKTRSHKPTQQETILHHFATSTTSTAPTCTRSTDNNATTHNAMAGTTNNDQDSVSNTELKEIMLRMESNFTKQMDALKREVSDINKKVEKNKTDISDIITSVEDNVQETSNIVNNIIPELKAACDEQLAVLAKEAKLKELHDRKPNLLFYGVPQPADETAGDLVDKMRLIFRTDFGLTEETVDNIYFGAIHRLPRKNKPEGTAAPDPVIIRFCSMIDRDGILTQQRVRPFFKDRKPVMAYTDLPVSMKQQRSQLVQHAKTLRRNGNNTRIRTMGLDVILEYRDKHNRRGDWMRYTPNNP